MSDEMDPAQVLEDAADLLLVRGRCRDTWGTSRGDRCFIGAVAEVAGLLNADMTVTPLGIAKHAAVQALLRQGGFEHLGDAFDWNDDPETTDDDVRDALLLAAKTLRNGEVES